MLVYAALIIQMEIFSISKLLLDKKDKIPIHSTKDFDDITERFLFRLFDTSTTSQIIVYLIVLFLIAADLKVKWVCSLLYIFLSPFYI